MKKKICCHEKLIYDNYFENVGSIDCLSIKEYYLDILNELTKEKYDDIYEYFQRKENKKYESNIKITTSDAYTLTDGPTIFLTENVQKIARFYLKVSKIPGDEIKTILNIINRNAKYVKELDKTLEQERQRMEKKNEKTMNRDEKGEEFKLKMEFEKKVEG